MIWCLDTEAYLHFVFKEIVHFGNMAYMWLDRYCMFIFLFQTGRTEEGKWESAI